MCVAGSRGLADDQHALTRKLMKHPGYRALFPHIKLDESGPTLRIAHGGSRSAYVASPGGGITGRGAAERAGVFLESSRNEPETTIPLFKASTRQELDAGICAHL
jgi:hypothetical protein